MSHTSPPSTARHASKDTMRRLIEGIDDLPSSPASAGRIITLATKPQPDLNELVNAIEADTAVSLKVLRMANSAGFNRTDKVEDIRQAAMLLGLETVSTIALCASVRDGLFTSFDASDPLVREYWRHCLACACAARLLALKVLPGSAGAAFAAGLIHDCGKLALLHVCAQEYAPLLADEFLTGQRLIEKEQETLGTDHCLAGKWLLERWKLPEVFVEAAWMHHQPPQAFLGEEQPSNSPGLIVALADKLAHEAMGTSFMAGADGQEGESAGLAAALGLDAKNILHGMHAAIGQEYAGRAALFDLHEDAGTFYFNALNRANRRLGRAALDLADKSHSLERDARCLRWVALAAVEMVKASSAQDVLAALAQCLQGHFGSPAGMACLLDPLFKVCEGHCWGFGLPLRAVTVRLDSGLAPLPEELDGLPHDFGGLLAGCPIRATALAGPEGPPVHYQNGVAMVSLTQGGEVFGELLFQPPGYTLSLEERSAVSLLAGLAAQTFQHLDLVARCERRSERLAQVMRTMQDMNDKLLKTQRLAAVGQLAAGAAHEINNPLAIISARAQLLEMREEDAAKKKGLRQMIEQIERISAILGSLMDFARPASPRMEPVNPRDVMDRVLSLVEGSLKAQRIGLMREYAADVPDIMADPRQIEQVLLNLALNAQHAMEGAGGSLTAGISYQPGKDTVTFTMTDTGVGIPKEYLDKIFDPFFTTKAEGKGTGLGLSTAYGIISAHKGRIEATSEQGQGACFTVELPRDLAKPARAQEDAAPARNPRQAVLVVDDERNIREIVREALETKGYATEVAEDGDKALELLKANRYRLMVLDIRMPSRDGLALLREAKSFADPHMPVLVLTGLASEQEMREARDLGATVCLRKPFQVEALMAQATQLLGEREQP